MARFLLECSMTLPHSIGETFAVFEDPRNLARITPPWLHFRITTPEPVVVEQGAHIDYRIQWLGLPMNWRTLITAYQPPSFFVDEQVRGPYSHWRHRHTFRQVARGTSVADRVEYELPLGLAGWAAHRAVVGRQLLSIFRFRQGAIGELIGGQGTEQRMDPCIRDLDGWLG